MLEARHPTPHTATSTKWLSWFFLGMNFLSMLANAASYFKLLTAAADVLLPWLTLGVGLCTLFFSIAYAVYLYRHNTFTLKTAALSIISAFTLPGVLSLFFIQQLSIPLSPLLGVLSTATFLLFLLTFNASKVMEGKKISLGSIILSLFSFAFFSAPTLVFLLSSELTSAPTMLMGGIFVLAYSLAALFMWINSRVMNAVSPSKDSQEPPSNTKVKEEDKWAEQIKAHVDKAVEMIAEAQKNANPALADQKEEAAKLQEISREFQSYLARIEALKQASEEGRELRNRLTQEIYEKTADVTQFYKQQISISVSEFSEGIEETKKSCTELKGKLSEVKESVSLDLLTQWESDVKGLTSTMASMESAFESIKKESQWASLYSEIAKLLTPPLEVKEDANAKSALEDLTAKKTALQTQFEDLKREPVFQSIKLILQCQILVPCLGNIPSNPEEKEKFFNGIDLDRNEVDPASINIGSKYWSMFDWKDGKISLVQLKEAISRMLSTENRGNGEEKEKSADALNEKLQNFLKELNAIIKVLRPQIGIFLNTSQVDLRKLPTPSALQKERDLTIGDLHGNFLKLLHCLVKEGILNLTQEEYAEMVAIHKAVIGLGEHLTPFPPFETTHVDGFVEKLDQVTSREGLEHELSWYLDTSHPIYAAIRETLKQELANDQSDLNTIKQKLRETLKQERTKMQREIKQHLNTFIQILSSKGPANLQHLRLLTLIGDEMADRCGSDEFMLALLEQLQEKSVPYEILLSNHSSWFIKAYEKKFTKESIDPYVGLLRQGASLRHMLNMHAEEEEEWKEKVQQKIDACYKPYLKLLSYKLNTETHDIFIQTHAPIGFETYPLLARQMGVDYDPSDEEKLAQSIDRINEVFQTRYVQTNKVHELFEEEQNRELLKRLYQPETRQQTADSPTILITEECKSAIGDATFTENEIERLARIVGTDVGKTLRETITNINAKFPKEKAQQEQWYNDLILSQEGVMRTIWNRPGERRSAQVPYAVPPEIKPPGNYTARFGHGHTPTTNDCKGRHFYNVDGELGKSMECMVGEYRVLSTQTSIFPKIAQTRVAGVQHGLEEKGAPKRADSTSPLMQNTTPVQFLSGQGVQQPSASSTPIANNIPTPAAITPPTPLQPSSTSTRSI